MRKESANSFGVVLPGAAVFWPFWLLVDCSDEFTF
jgi:hypothetical protein